MAEKKYVILRLNNEEYGIDINEVKEVSESIPVTVVPGTPHYVEGIASFRGEILQVLNLKRRLGLSEDEIKTKTEKLIVVNRLDKLMGLLVDDATHILTFEDENINAPDLIDHFDSMYIKGIGKIDDRIIILLDLENLFQ